MLLFRLHQPDRALRVYLGVGSGKSVGALAQELGCWTSDVRRHVKQLGALSEVRQATMPVPRGRLVRVAIARGDVQLLAIIEMGLERRLVDIEAVGPTTKGDSAWEAFQERWHSVGKGNPRDHAWLEQKLPVGRGLAPTEATWRSRLWTLLAFTQGWDLADGV